jgi:RNA polymerase sigma-70 factor (ECF subfamily)
LQDVLAINDKDLILQAKKGNDIAFEQLVHRYDRQVFSIAANYVRSAEEAKDIYQEAFIRVYKGLPKFEFRSEFSTWLFRIVTNVCLTHRARKNMHASLDENMDEEGEYHTYTKTLQSEDNADNDLTNSEIRSQVQYALDDLSPKQRVVFTLKHFHGYKLKEIASMMECTEGTVKKYLFTAVEKMRKKLKDFYY